MKKLVVILGFLIFGIFFARIHAVPASNDFYWHLATGRQIYTEKKIPTVDSFTYAAKNPVYVPTEWLYELAAFVLFKQTGMFGLLGFRVLIGLLIMAVLFKTFRLFSNNLPLIMSGLTVSAYVLGFRLNDRPEIISYLFLAVVNYTCLHFYFKKTFSKLFFLLPIVFLLWPNVHPYGILGYAVFGFWMGYSLFFAKKEKLKQKRILLLLFLAVSFSFLLQYERVFYFLKAENLNNPELSSLFVRVGAIKSFQFWRQIPFDIYVFGLNLILFLALTVALIAKRRIKKDLIIVDLFYLAVVLLVFRFFRLLPAAMLLVLPWIFYQLALLPTGKWFKSWNLLLYLQFAFIGVLIFSSITFGYLLGDRTFSLYYLDKAQKPVAVRNRTWLAEYPVGASKYIAENLGSVRIYSIVNWNNYLLWAMPVVRVFRTAQPEYLTRTMELDEEKLRLGLGNWRELLDKYRIDTVVNTFGDQFRTSNVPVYNLKNWRLVYVDEISAVYARDNVKNRRPLELSGLNLQSESLVKFDIKDKDIVKKQLESLLEVEPKNSFAREQLILLYLLSNDLEKAKQLGEESRKILPRDPVISVYLSTIYANLGNCEQAFVYAKQAQKDSYNDYWIEKRAQAVLGAKCGL